MIIQRMKVPMEKLFATDKEAEAVFMDAARSSYGPGRVKKNVEMLKRFSLFECEMGWAIRNIGRVFDEFDRLDREKPYEVQ